jgi:translation initiation factor IF-2
MEKAQEKNTRTPIVAILGHVDHGKTTILDYIRRASVASGEAGGITQRISVFTVNTPNERQITFIDTPGHEAFDLMRTRGGSVADVVLLIVAANDGVMPQTKESIEIIKRSSARPIIVLNKCDLPDINIDKIKREISILGLLPDDLGGHVPVVKVSGKTGNGISDLLETINLVVDVEGLPDKGDMGSHATGRGVVLESVKDKSKGNVSSFVVLKGTFEKGDNVVYLSGKEILVDKVKGFVTEDGQTLDILTEGQGAKIIGLSGQLNLGSDLVVIKDQDKKQAEEIYREVSKMVAEVDAVETELSKDELLADFFGIGAESAETKSAQNSKRKLNVIIKASSEGSLEAIAKSLGKIESDQVELKIQAKGLGDISQKDIDHASVTKSIILGFDISMENGSKDLAEKKRVLIRSYDIIYKLVDEVKDTIEMLESGQEVEEEIGSAEVRQIFTLSNGTKVIGCKVREGILKRNEKCYVVRKDDIIGKGKIGSMKHLKSEVNEVKVGFECGIVIEPTPADIEIGDSIHCFKIVS